MGRTPTGYNLNDILNICFRYLEFSLSKSEFRLKIFRCVKEIYESPIVSIQLNYNRRTLVHILIFTTQLL